MHELINKPIRFIRATLVVDAHNTIVLDTHDTLPFDVREEDILEITDEHEHDHADS
jgi:hypothetical protein